MSSRRQRCSRRDFSFDKLHDLVPDAHFWWATGTSTTVAGSQAQLPMQYKYRSLRKNSLPAATIGLALNVLRSSSLL